MDHRGRFACLLASFLCFFRLAAQPVIYGFSPASAGVGAQIAIYGANLTPLTAVQFFGSGTYASVVAATSSEIVVVVPYDAQTGPVAVYASGGVVSSPTSFYVAPQITSFYTKLNGNSQPVIPVVGSVGQQVTITGNNFYDPSGALAVFFNGVQAGQAQAVADTLIYATVPAGASTGYITVTNTAGASVSSAYFYMNPVLTSLPTNALPGQSVSFVGSSFLGVTSVSLGATPLPFVVASPTNITATLPVDAVDGAISIVAPGGAFITTSSLKILPLITGFSPQGGPAGTVVTLAGGGFTAATSVSFGSLPAASYSVVSATNLTATAPANVASGIITVVTPNGSAFSPSGYFAPPKLFSATPSSGQAGATITLAGAGLSGATAVSLGALPASFTVVNDTTISAQVPLSATVNGYWSVVTPGGAATNPSPFVVIGPQPSIASFSPAYGPPGTVVTIQGVNLLTTTSVSFNGALAAFSLGANALTATVPANATSGPIYVTNPYGSAPSATSFVVGSSADVSLSISPQQNPAYAYSPWVVVVPVINAGPLPAAAPAVTVGLSTNLSFVSLDGAVNYNLVGTNVLVSPGDLASGGFLNLVFHLRAGAPGTATVTASVQSTTPDSHPANNKASAQVPVVLPSLEIDPADAATFTLLWPSPATNFVLQAAAAAGGAWTAVTNAPADDGVTRQLLLPYAGANRFYRLRYGGN